jgi:hypothetical protein
MRRILCSIGALLAVSVLADHARADDWMLRVETSSRVCHVQLVTASPLGADLKGPFSSRKDACTEASNQYDSTLSDTSKCWTYGHGTIDWCSSENVNLPH